MIELREKIRKKLRHGLVWKWLSDRLEGLGIQIKPWYLMLEGTFGRPSPFNPGDFADLECYHPVAADAPAMVAEKDGIRLEYLEKAFAAGRHCLALRRSGEIVAYTWVNLNAIEVDLLPAPRPLASNEAYLFNAYTSKALRGPAILPYLRDLAYRELEALGRTRCYSISEFTNQPSIRFKQKLGAEFLELHLSVCLFNRFKRTWLLRKYNE